jgi:bacterial/archaeal transporter family protein
VHPSAASFREKLELGMLQQWLILSIVALLIWGSWGLLANLTVRYLDGFSALVWEVVGALIVGVAVFIWLARNGGLETTGRGVTYGVLTGITYTVGLACLFLALHYLGSRQVHDTGSSNVHTVLVLTALYPVIAMALNYFILGEAVSIRQLFGMGIGLLGIAILVTS